MQRKTKTPIICIEEHYWDPEISQHFSAAEGSKAPGIQPRLHDLGDGEYRLREMDEAGIDFQVLSHGAPSTQKFDPETAVKLARAANDKLHRAITAHPDRLRPLPPPPTPTGSAPSPPCRRPIPTPPPTSSSAASRSWDSRAR